MSPENLIRNIDWEHLRTQKEGLIEVMWEDTDKYAEMEGLLTLLDSIQDCAVYVLNIPFNEVYGYKQE